jgi:hypothetical protein
MTMVTEPSLNSAFLYSVQRALPDQMPDGVRGVALDADEKTLYIRCHFDGPVTAEARAFMGYMREAVWADFFPTIHVEVEAVEAGMEPDGTWVFQRTERVLAHA